MGLIYFTHRPTDNIEILGDHFFPQQMEVGRNKHIVICRVQSNPDIAQRFFFCRSLWAIYRGRRQIYALYNAEIVFADIRRRQLRVVLYCASVILLNDLSHTRSIVIGTGTGYYGSWMVQLVEAQRFKLKGSVFDSRWDHCHFLLT